MNDMNFVTFRPLARGRYRCNFKGCGVAVKKSRLDAHRNYHTSLRVAINEPPKLKAAKIFAGCLVGCPYCSMPHRASVPQDMKCSHCHKNFSAV